MVFVLQNHLLAHVAGLRCEALGAAALGRQSGLAVRYPFIFDQPAFERLRRVACTRLWMLIRLEAHRRAVISAC